MDAERSGRLIQAAHVYFFRPFPRQIGRNHSSHAMKTRRAKRERIAHPFLKRTAEIVMTAGKNRQSALPLFPIAGRQVDRNERQPVFLQFSGNRLRRRSVRKLALNVRKPVLLRLGKTGQETALP